ncbi:hypothetical protein HJFPF1_00497 [Paramyrothecium foliicola]|nr:hypothetical protein HJFPF1_00497 [Paramyrothecium foliicola]
MSHVESQTTGRAKGFDGVRYSNFVCSEVLTLDQESHQFYCTNKAITVPAAGLSFIATMSSKRPAETSEAGLEAKRPRHGFRVGPENLPDGPWRRKVTKIKKELIHKAKVKKAYAKIKAREEQTHENASQPEPSGEHAVDEKPGSEETEEQLHPTRKLMLKDEDVAQASATGARNEEPQSDGHRRRTRRPGYYDKQLKKAEEQRSEVEAKRREFQRRQEERERKMAERERYKKAMAKTRDKNGKKKLGREGNLLLDKVKRIVAQDN